VELRNENEVVDVVAKFLAAKGFAIVQTLHGHQRGVDIIASRADIGALHLEAKGGTSTVATSKKYGKPMSPGEVRINVAEAFYTAALAAARRPGDDREVVLAAVAFHDDARHRRYVDPLRAALDELGIGVFWVTPPQPGAPRRPLDDLNRAVARGSPAPGRVSGR